MGIFGSIGRAVTGPFRALGELVQGHPRGFVGALGDVVKPAAIVGSAIPGPHQALTIPAAAVGGAMQKADDPGQRGVGNFLTGAAQGASMAGGARMASGLARAGYGALAGGGGGGAGAVPLSPASATSKAGYGVGETVGGIAQKGGLPTAGATTRSALTSAAPWSPTRQAERLRMAPSALPSAAPATSKMGYGVGETVGGITQKQGGGMLKGIGDYLTQHPELVPQAMGTAADVYSAGQRGAAIDRQLEFRRETEEERQRQNELQMLLQAIASMQQRGY